MILALLLIVAVVGGVLAWLAGRWGDAWPRWVSLAALAVELALVLWIWMSFSPGTRAGSMTLAAAITPGTSAGAKRAVEFATQNHTLPWLDELDCPWIAPLGVRFHLALDGLSLPLILLTVFLGIIAVAASWTEVHQRVGFFHFNLMAILAGIMGVFLAMDLFLFYFFWELMLVPMYFLIAIWGHENRQYAAVKFFLFTQFSGLLMLLAILGLYFIHRQTTGIYTFDYAELLGTPLAHRESLLVMLGFAAAFAVKLPVVPLHTWLPDAHTEAPTAGSVILAGLLLKTGAYGLLRFAVPLLPMAAAEIAPAAMTLGVVGILYGAVLASAQTDLKRMVAYTSVSHMGYVLLGIFAGSELALQGVVIQMLCHGLSTGGLFVVVGILQERTHTRDLRRLGGLWVAAPRLGGSALFFALASLGLPGLGNFVGEFLVLLGTYRVSVPLAAAASLGFIVSTVYALWMIQAAFQGRYDTRRTITDLGRREMAVIAALVLALVWLGVYPQPVLDASRPAVQTLQQNRGGGP